MFGKGVAKPYLSGIIGLWTAYPVAVYGLCTAMECDEEDIEKEKDAHVAGRGELITGS